MQTNLDAVSDCQPVILFIEIIDYKLLQYAKHLTAKAGCYQNMKWEDGEWQVAGGE